MASLRRNKTLSPDGQTARFLYTIIKQLDLKAIDWNLVAESLEITNGHAARMRYSRFRQHMEGVTTQPRAPRAGGKKEKEGLEKEKPKRGKKRGLEEDGDGKRGETAPVKGESAGLEEAGVRVKREGGLRIKAEPDEITARGAAIQIKPEPGVRDNCAVPEALPAIKIKPEPTTDTDANPDIWRVLPRAKTTPERSPSLFEQTPRSATVPVPALHAIPAYVAPPLPPQQTVSLAELEVSPRSQPLVLAGMDGSAPRSFTDGPFSAHKGVRDGTRSNVQIKPEPDSGLDVEWLPAPPSGEAMVKREPLET
jgi:hypothetical protein